MLFGKQPWLEVQQIHLGSIIERSTELPNQNFTQELENINKLFVEGIPIFNYWFKVQHFKIPETLFGIFKLSDTKVSYYDGFIEVAFTPTFIPPTESAFIKPLRAAKPTFYKYEESIDYTGAYSFKTFEDELESGKFMQ